MNHLVSSEPRRIPSPIAIYMAIKGRLHVLIDGTWHPTLRGETLAKDEVWKTLDGRVIPVGQLDAEHARNIIRMMIRKRRKEIAAGAVIAYRAVQRMNERLGVVQPQGHGPFEEEWDLMQPQPNGDGVRGIL